MRYNNFTVMFAFELRGHVFTETKEPGSLHCCYTTIIQHPLTFKNAINKIVVSPKDQQFTCNLPEYTGQLPVCLQAHPTG